VTRRFAVATTILLTAAGAAAQQPSRQEPSATTGHLGLRTGYGIPIGRYAKKREIDGSPETDVKALGDDTNGAIPIWVDVGYRLHENLLVGLYAMYGVALFKAAADDDPLAERGGCPEGFDCAASGWRFGLQGELQLLPAGSIRPWASVGLGYELIGFSYEGQFLGSDFSVSGSYAGFELLHLQAGADVALSAPVTVGPFASFSLGQYGSCTDEWNEAERDCEITRGVLHEWLVLGLRGTLGI
jgi:hypothetical protein